MPEDFAALAIPLTVVATDLHASSEAAFTAGALKPAVAASMAVPGLVRPIEIGGRVLVDGGAINPLPFDHLRGRADVIVAVDCSGGPSEPRGIPDPWEALFATIHVMGQSIVAEKLKAGGPDLVIRPNVGAFRMLDFFRASAILRAAEPVKAQVKERLEALAQRRSRKKPFEQRRRLRLADAAIDLRPVVAGGRGEEPHAVFDRPALRIGGAVIKPAGCGQTRSPPRTWRRARASRRGRSRQGARSRSPPRPRGSPASPHAPSGRDRRAVRLNVLAITAPLRTITQPTGTSPAAAAVCASIRAKSMKEGGSMSLPRHGRACPGHPRL